MTTNNNFQTVYYLTDKTKHPLNAILFTTTSFEDVIYELLTIIDHKITFLRSLNVNLANVHFNNLVINCIKNNTSPHMQILDEVIYDISQHTIMSTCDGQKFNIYEKHIKSLFSKIESQFGSSNFLTNTVISQIPNQIMQNQKIQEPKEEMQQLQNDISTIMGISKNDDNTEIIISEKDINAIGDFLSDDEDSSDEQESDSESEDDEEDDGKYANKIKLNVKSVNNFIKNKENTINELQEKANKKEQDYIENKCILDSKNAELRRLKERAEERQRVFESERDVTYIRIKDQLETTEMTEDNIPLMFVDKYPIFKLLDAENILHTDEDYEMYCNLYDKMYPKKAMTKRGEYIPHNVNYLPEEKKKQYEKMKVDSTDIVQEFINKNSIPSTTLKSSDEILKELESSDDDSCDNDSSDSSDNADHIDSEDIDGSN